MWLFVICLGNAFEYKLAKLKFSGTHKMSSQKKCSLSLNHVYGLAFTLDKLFFNSHSRTQKQKTIYRHPKLLFGFISAFWLDHKNNVFRMHNPMKNVTKIASISKSHQVKIFVQIFCDTPLSHVCCHQFDTCIKTIQFYRFSIWLRGKNSSLFTLSSAENHHF